MPLAKVLLGIECKSNDKEVLKIISVLEDKVSSQRCLAERSFLRELEGDVKFL